MYILDEVWKFVVPYMRRKYIFFDKRIIGNTRDQEFGGQKYFKSIIFKDFF